MLNRPNINKLSWLDKLYSTLPQPQAVTSSAGTVIRGLNNSYVHLHFETLKHLKLQLQRNTQLGLLVLMQLLTSEQRN